MDSNFCHNVEYTGNQLKKTKIFYSSTECDKEIQRLKLLQRQHQFCPEVIPPELADLDQWVVWSYEVHQWKNGTFGVGKVPYQAKVPNRKASTTTPLDWCDLETAVQCVESDWHPADGIGFVFSRADGLSGVDFDNCRDPLTEHIREEYQFWIDALEGYAEVSPSGTGVKVWVKGTISDRYFKTEESTGFRILNFAGGEIEVYRRGQYFTVTTQCLKDVEFITPAQTELDVLSEWSLSKISRDISYYCSSVLLPTDEDAKRELSLLEEYLDEINYEYIDESYSQVQPMTQSAVETFTDSDLYPVGDVSYINVGQSRCRRCGRKCNQNYELCYECYNDGEPEYKVMEAVFNYFSEPKFRENGFSPKKDEHYIRIGVYTPRPDVVLFDRQGNLAAVAECKRGGITNYGIEQLWSYLTASDVQFGVFANSTEPDEWIFFENLRRYHFKDDISRSQFEAEIVAGQPVESIREEKGRLDRKITEIGTRLDRKGREIKSSSERLDDLNQKVKQANNQLADIKKEIILLREKSTDLTEKITRDSQQAEVLEGLKLESTRNNLEVVIHRLRNKGNQLQNEIGGKEQQRTDLSEEVNLLKGDRDELEREKNRIKSEREILEREKEIWRDGEKDRKNYNDYLEQINAKLEKSIKHKDNAVRDLNRLSKLYEQIREELERLDKLESEIKSKQQLAQQNQKKHAAYEQNGVETNQKFQQSVQVSQEREFILKQLRIVVNQLRTANSEQKLQIEENRRQLVRDLRERKSICVQLIREINNLKKAKSELEEEIRQERQQVPFEENEVSPAYVQIQLEINELKTEKSKIEAKIGHQIFLQKGL